MDRHPQRIHYRRRPVNTGFKAGNIMDFLCHRAEGFELMLTLDADSEMSAAAVLRLVRAMQADPTLAIAQHLTVGLPAASAFPRLFQFGMRAGMRTWATGQAWWQGDEGPYWGHNAVVRIAPFRALCRLPTLPSGPCDSMTPMPTPPPTVFARQLAARHCRQSEQPPPSWRRSR